MSAFIAFGENVENIKVYRHLRLEEKCNDIGYLYKFKSTLWALYGLPYSNNQSESFVIDFYKSLGILSLEEEGALLNTGRIQEVCLNQKLWKKINPEFYFLLSKPKQREQFEETIRGVVNERHIKRLEENLEADLARIDSQIESDKHFIDYSNSMGQLKRTLNNTIKTMAEFGDIIKKL